MRSAVFLPDAGNARQPRNIVAANGSHHFVGGHATQDRDRQLGADAAHRDQFLEQQFLRGTQKSVERDQVFAHMRVDVQRDLGADCRQGRKTSAR